MNLSILKYGFLIVLVSLIESCRQSQEEIKNPNILLIYMDDLGYGDVSSYGVGTLYTPNIDRISENGFRNNPYSMIVKKVSIQENKNIGNFTYYIGWYGKTPISLNLDNRKHKKKFIFNIIYK